MLLLRKPFLFPLPITIVTDFSVLSSKPVDNSVSQQSGFVDGANAAGISFGSRRQIDSSSPSN